MADLAQKDQKETKGEKSKKPPRKTASALSYSRGEKAPRVVAAGEGRTALRIIESAQEAGIPVIEDGGLAALLFGLPPGAFIPENAYRAAAAVFAFLEKAKQKKWL